MVRFRIGFLVGIQQYTLSQSSCDVTEVDLHYWTFIPSVSYKSSR